MEGEKERERGEGWGRVGGGEGHLSVCLFYFNNYIQIATIELPYSYCR